MKITVTGKKNNVIFHDILTHSSDTGEGAQMKSTLGSLYDHALLPKEEGDQPTDVLIFGDHVALITLSDPIYGTVLESTLLAQTFRTIWRTMRRGV